MVRHTPARCMGRPGAGCSRASRTLVAFSVLATCAAAERPDSWWAAARREGEVWWDALNGLDYHLKGDDRTSTKPGGRVPPNPEGKERS
eukprot:7389278-Heterocapsa_arctica.AAC.1